MQTTTTLPTPCDIAERQRLSYLLVGLIAVLVCVGIQMVHSSSLTSRPSVREQQFLVRHLAFLAFSTFAAWLVSRVPAHVLQRNATVVFWSFVVLLALYTLRPAPRRSS